MATASVSIHLASDDALSSRKMFEVRVSGPDGRPLGGVDLVVTLEGSGSLSPNFSSSEFHREVPETGETVVTWYRRGIFGREIKATLSVSVERAGATVSLAELSPEQMAKVDGPRTGFVPPPPLRLPPTRA
jgi:hypothetical protein